MEYVLEVDIFIACEAGLMAAGHITKPLIADSLPKAQKDAERVLIRNRMKNPEHIMRFKLELLSQGTVVWKLDETNSPVQQSNISSEPSQELIDSAIVRRQERQ